MIGIQGHALDGMLADDPGQARSPGYAALAPLRNDALVESVLGATAPLVAS